MDKFHPAVIENLRHYVYFLIDPRDNKIFYVGKGQGNRVFAHAKGALKKALSSDKMKLIRKIIREGRQVRHVIHRHGLEENEALAVEASLIEAFGLEGLKQKVQGKHTRDRGQMTVEQVAAKYRPRRIKIRERSILINLTKSYRRGMDDFALYKAVRGNWQMGKRREKADLAFAIYRGVVHGVYSIQCWEKSDEIGRVRFEGSVASNLRLYVGGSVKHYFSPGARSTFIYLHC